MQNRKQIRYRLEAYRSNLTLFASRFEWTDIKAETARIEKALAILDEMDKKEK